MEDGMARRRVTFLRVGPLGYKTGGWVCSSLRQLATGQLPEVFIFLQESRPSLSGSEALSPHPLSGPEFIQGPLSSSAPSSLQVAVSPICSFFTDRTGLSLGKSSPQLMLNLCGLCVHVEELPARSIPVACFPKKTLNV